MPIKRLQSGPALFPEIGQLRKGDQKTASGQVGKELPWFRLTSEDPDVLQVFHEFYGKEPRSVNILLPYETVDENLECWQEKWSAGALQHRCDGETMVRWLTPDGKYSDEPKRCTGGCKEVMRLKVIVPELKRLAYLTVLSTSIHDIVNVTKQLKAIYALRGNLQGIPLILRRVPQEISTPRKDGSRARSLKHLLQVEAAPSFVELQLADAQRAALGASYQAPQLPAPPEEIEDAAYEELDEESGELPPKFSPKLLAAAQEIIELAQATGAWVFDMSEQYAALETDQELKEFGVMLLGTVRSAIKAAANENEFVLPEGFEKFKTPDVKVFLAEHKAALFGAKATDQATAAEYF